MAVTRKGQQYRHTPAFLLLFLAQSASYGGALLARLESEMPHCQADSAVVYRTLQDLEEEGSVESYWEHASVGPGRKWYRITEAGRQKLQEHKEDIEMRIRNLQYFLETYQSMFSK